MNEIIFQQVVEHFPAAIIDKTLKGLGKLIIADVKIRKKERVAIKYNGFYLLSGNKQHYDSILSHLFKLSTLKGSQYVAETKAVFIPLEGSSLGIVMKNYSMNLRQFIKSRELNEHQSIALFKRCVKCVQELHNRDIVHGNIKGQNFLLGGSDIDQNNINSMIGSLVVSDFDTLEGMEYSNQSLFSFGRSLRITFAYSAPEIKKCISNDDDLVFSKSTDIYSLGVLLGAIITRTEPFSMCKTQYQILSTKKNHFDNGDNETKLASCRKAFLIYQFCTRTLEEERPKSCEDILYVLSEENTEKAIQRFDSKKFPLKINYSNSQLCDITILIQ